jgi:uncharacterized membrane protein
MAMKVWLASLTAMLVLNSANAQLFSPEAWNGALFGALLGGSVGGDRHCGWSGNGAAIGAGVGFVAGALIGEANRERYDNAPYAYSRPAYGYAYSYGPGYSGYYSPGARPNYAVSGTLTGAAAGALIGEGTSGKPGQGAAIGAAVGLVLGSVAEQQARQRERADFAGHRLPVTVVPDRPSVWQASLAPRHQIPDAPRVPDAPTF